MNRREFLSLSALAATSLATTPSQMWAKATSRPGSFDFLFLTDSHIQPELAASDGCAMCFKKARSLHADFAIQGGDHVFDVLAVDRQRANSLYDLYARTEQSLSVKVHHTIGNHDVFGVYPKSGIGLAEPGYGKRMYEDRIGQTYYSFDHKGYHFVVLDSIQITNDRSWEAGIDAAQLAWLAKDLEALPAGMPIIIAVHVPLVTGAVAHLAPYPGKNDKQIFVCNTYEVVRLFEGHNILAVLQGHLHLNEQVTYKGVPYLTNGAVSGNWWHGTRLGTPEGFTVVSLRKGKIQWRYETYGFQSVDPQNT